MCPTIGACPVPLGKQVLADFVSEQGPLLIGDAGYFRVLQVLQIEAHQFLREGGNMGHAAEARNPAQDAVTDSGATGGASPHGDAGCGSGELGIWSGGNVGPCAHPTGVQRFLDRGSPMGQFRRPHHFTGRIINEC